MLVVGKLYTTQSEALAAIVADESDWTRPAYVDHGGGVHVDHATLPALNLVAPLEMQDGRFLVPAVMGAVFRNDTPAKRARRTADAVPVGDIKRDTSTPRDLVQIGKAR